MKRILIQTDNFGKVVLRHHNESKWDDLEGTVVKESNIPERPDVTKADVSLYYIDGKFEYKISKRYKLEQKEDVEGLKEWMTERAKRIRKDKSENIIEWDGYEWKTDTDSRQSIMEVLEGARLYNKTHSDSFSTTWITASGPRTNTTVEDLETLVSKIRSQRQKVFQQYATLVEAINSASTISELNAVDVTGGW